MVKIQFMPQASSPALLDQMAHLLLVEVVGEAGPEGFLRQELVHHPDDGGSFGV